MLRKVLGREMEFRVFWKIEIHADSPQQAIEQARAVQLNPAMPATVFEVWDHSSRRMNRIDLESPAGRLTNDEVALLRGALRQRQCAPGLEADGKEMLAVMLIFLDAEEGHSRRH